MREMQTKEIQQIGLDMMKNIHSFCTKNDIKYSLAYGTMLGAIRHQGFIPWDDDVDIMMPRPDYERFLQLYKSDDYFLKSVYDKDCYTNFSRLYECKRTRNIQRAAPCDSKVGVYVDVFPIDGVYDKPSLREAKYQRIRELALGRIAYRHIYPNVKEGKMMSRIHALFSIMKIYVKLGGNINTIGKKIQRLSSEVILGSTKSCSYFCCNDAIKANKQEIFPTEAFRKFQLHKFETEMFYVSAYYDEMLTTMYGDYMTLPPMEKRGTKHDFEKFYWND